MTETNVKKSIMSAKSQLEAVKDATASANDALSSLQLLLKDDDDSMDLLRKQITHMEGKRKREILKRHKTFCRIWNPEGHPEIFKTYLPDPLNKRGRRITEAASLKALEEKIVSWYLADHDQPMTFEDCYNAWFREEKEHYVSNQTIVRYKQDIDRYFLTKEKDTVFYHKAMRDFTESMVHTFIMDHLHEDRLCREAVKDLFRILKETFGYAWRKRIIDENPCARLSLSQYTRQSYPSRLAGRKETISAEEWQLISAQMSLDQADGLMTAFAAELLSLTGMRPGEAAGLKWENIDKEDFFIVNTRKYDPLNNMYYDGDVKNKRPRWFPLTEDIKDLLRRTRAAEEEKNTLSEYVFSDENGALTTGKISSYIKNKCRQLGLSHEYCSYSIRKTVNSVTKACGTTTLVASSILGHTPEVNERYYTKDVAKSDERARASEFMNLGKWAETKEKSRSTQVNTFLGENVTA